MRDFRQFAVQRTHLRDHQLDRRALFVRNLAADQVVRLDACSPLVYRGDARVAQVLRRAGFLHETHAAVYLHANRGNFNALLGAPAFDHRRKQIEQCLVPGALGLVRVQQCLVQICRSNGRNRPHGFGLRFHAHQHAAHVRMVNDGDAITSLDADLTTLHAGPGVLQSMLVGALGDGDAFDADLQPGEVHHGEHELQPTVLVTDQVADRAVRIAVSHHAGRAAVDAELVFDGNAFDVVALA